MFGRQMRNGRQAFTVHANNACIAALLSLLSAQVSGGNRSTVVMVVVVVVGNASGCNSGGYSLNSRQ